MVWSMFIFSLLYFFHLIIEENYLKDFEKLLAEILEVSLMNTIIHKKHAISKYNYENKNFWAKEYYISTDGLNQKTLEKYLFVKVYI